jgi:hypothetical protein
VIGCAYRAARPLRATSAGDELQRSGLTAHLTTSRTLDVASDDGTSPLPVPAEHLSV